ncbi:MAG: VC0807 family protein, partial [Tumebacillaceae bacterium]
RFTVGNDPTAQATFASRWQYPYFRMVMRAMTAVWGLALLAEALIRTLLVFRMSVNAFLAVSPVITYGIIGLTILWTVLFRRHAAKRLQIMIR